MRIRGLNCVVLVFMVAAAACGGSGEKEAVLDIAQEDAQATEDVVDDNLGVEVEVEDDVAEDYASDESSQYSEFDEVTAISFQAVLDESIAFSGDPGASLTVLTDDLRWWSGASGVADVVTGEPLEPWMGFRVGSNTKPFIATVMLQLQDEGKVDLDDSIGDYLLDYPQWDGVTIRNLLGMQSGIPDYLNHPDFLLTAFFEPEVLGDPHLLLTYVSDLPMDFPPGEGCHYCNTNYVLAGLIIEEVTGNPVSQEIDQRIVQPLGLDITHLDVEGGVNEGLSHGYLDIHLMSMLFNIDLDVSAVVPEELYVDGSVVDATYLFPPAVAWSAGALVSSTEDMVRFMKALLAGELTSPEALAEMKETVYCGLMTGNLEYGLGLQIHESEFGASYGHGGLFFGYQANTLRLDSPGVTYSSMHNYLPEQADFIRDLLFGFLMEPPAEPYQPCLFDEGFFDLESGENMTVRFHGTINMPASPTPLPGLANIKWYSEEKKWPLYGIHAGAKMEYNPQGDRVLIDSFAPGVDTDADVRQATFSVARDFLLGIDGYKDLSFLDPSLVYAVVSDIWMDDMNQPEKICFVALADLQRPGRMQICKDEGFEAKVGDDLQLFASIALETDPERVEMYLGYLGLAPCICPNGEGEWSQCE